jgi:hypothetical protein
MRLARREVRPCAGVPPPGESPVAGISTAVALQALEDRDLLRQRRQIATGWPRSVTSSVSPRAMRAR